MNRFTPVLGILLLAVAGPAASGDLYKWVDDRGRVHYGDTPPQKAQLEKLTGIVSSYSSLGGEPLQLDSTPGQAADKPKSVVMYSTRRCSFCKQARRYFHKRDIPYQEYDIEKSSRAAGDFKKPGGRGLPEIVIDQQRMTDFSAEIFDRIYYGS